MEQGSGQRLSIHARVSAHPESGEVVYVHVARICGCLQQLCVCINYNHRAVSRTKTGVGLQPCNEVSGCGLQHHAHFDVCTTTAGSVLDVKGMHCTCGMLNVSFLGGGATFHIWILSPQHDTLHNCQAEFWSHVMIHASHVTLPEG